MHTFKFKCFFLMLSAPLFLVQLALADLEHCMELLSVAEPEAGSVSQPQIEAVFRRLLTESGRDFPSTADLEQMERAADPFRMKEGGQSHREHLRLALEKLRGIVEKTPVREKLKDSLLLIAREMLEVRRAAEANVGRVREEKASPGHRLVLKAPTETENGPETNASGQLVVADPTKITWMDPASGKTKLFPLNSGGGARKHLWVLKLWNDATVWASSHGTIYLWNPLTGKSAVAKSPKSGDRVIRLKDDFFVTEVLYQNDYRVAFHRISLASEKLEKAGTTEVPLRESGINGENIVGFGPAPDGTRIRIITKIGRVWECDPFESNGRAQVVFDLTPPESTGAQGYTLWEQARISDDGNRFILVGEDRSVKVFDGSSGEKLASFNLPPEVDTRYHAAPWITSDGRFIGYPGARGLRAFILINTEEAGRSSVVKSIPVTAFDHGAIAIPVDGQSILFRTPEGKLYQAEVEE